MTTKRFQVCFTGDIEIGFSVDEVKKNLALLFKGDQKKAALFFSGGKKIIKKGVDFQTAEKYQQKLKQVGAVCQIEALDPKDQTPKSLPSKETMACPKCGFEQEKKSECVRCGIIIEKFLENPDLSGQKEVQSRAPDLHSEPEESFSTLDGLRKKKHPACHFSHQCYPPGSFPVFKRPTPSCRKDPRRTSPKSGPDPNRCSSFYHRSGGKGLPHLSPLQL